MIHPRPDPDTLPHSRACGIHAHAHGTACAPDCPTCHPARPLDAKDVPLELVAPEELFAYGLRGILAGLGVDPYAPDVVDTPARVVRALGEMTAGYAQDPAEFLSRTFPVQGADSMVIVRDVPFESLCAHHLLPFAGTAALAYIPAAGAPVVGLSKLARVLDVYTRRLQTQEQIGVQVTTALDKHLDAVGSACVLSASHGCMAHRGVRKPGSVMVTSSLTGRFLHDGATRAEFMALAGVR